MKTPITRMDTVIFFEQKRTKESLLKRCPETHKKHPSQTQKTTTMDRCLDLATVERVSTSPNTHLSFKIKGDIGITIFQSPELVIIGSRDYVYPKNVKKFMSKKYLKLHTHKKHEPFIFR
jgi:hypothetical protein